MCVRECVCAGLCVRFCEHVCVCACVCVRVCVFLCVRVHANRRRETKSRTYETKTYGFEGEKEKRNTLWSMNRTQRTWTHALTNAKKNKPDTYKHMPNSDADTDGEPWRDRKRETEGGRESVCERKRERARARARNRVSRGVGKEIEQYINSSINCI